MEQHCRTVVICAVLPSSIATDLALLATLREGAWAESPDPLGNHQIAFGVGLCAQSAFAYGCSSFSAKSVAHGTLVEFVATLESSVSFPFVASSLPLHSSPNRGVLLRRGIPLLAIRRASARVQRTGSPRLAQLDTRLFGLLLTRFSEQTHNKAQRAADLILRVRERRRARAAGGERRGDAVRRSAGAGRKRDEEAYSPTKSRAVDRSADGGSVDAANGAGREGSEEPPRTH